MGWIMLCWFIYIVLVCRCMVILAVCCVLLFYIDVFRLMLSWLVLVMVCFRLLQWMMGSIGLNCFLFIRCVLLWILVISVSGQKLFGLFGSMLLQMMVVLFLWVLFISVVIFFNCMGFCIGFMVMLGCKLLFMGVVVMMVLSLVMIWLCSVLGM